MGLFRRRPQGAAENTSGLAPTGHEGDDLLLAQIASHGDIDSPRHWVHYLYFPDEATARSAAHAIEAAGWGIQQVDVSASGGPEWVVIAERLDAVLEPDQVRAAREFFETIAVTHGNGEYDGWEASL